MSSLQVHLSEVLKCEMIISLQEKIYSTKVPKILANGEKLSRKEKDPNSSA